MRFMFFPGGTYIAGMEVVTFDLMLALMRQGHDCYAIASGWNDGAYPAMLRNEVKYAEVRLGRLYRSKPMWTLAGLLHLPGATLRLRRIIREFRPDALIVPSVEYALTALQVVPRRLPVLFHAHNAPNPNWRGWIGDTVFRRVSGVIAPSAFIRDEVATVRPELRIGVVYNGTRVPTLIARIPATTLRVGIVGQLTQQKRHHVLVEALRRLDQSQRERVSLHIFGNDRTAYADGIKARCSNLGVQVLWRGFRPHVDIYRTIDVLAALGPHEAFGMTLIEAALHSLPVIASRSGAHPEIVRDGETGLLVTLDDPESLANAVVRLDDANTRMAMGDAARKRCAEHFSIDSMAKGFVQAARDFGIAASARPPLSDREVPSNSLLRRQQ